MHGVQVRNSHVFTNLFNHKTKRIHKFPNWRIKWLTTFYITLVPLYEFPCGILGIVPSSPGFESVEITPQLRWLEEAAGLLASCKGDIEVKWTSTEKDARYLIVRVPLGIRVTLVLPNGERRSFTDVEKIELDITI